jgi:hypothetical protein
MVQLFGKKKCLGGNMSKDPAVFLSLKRVNNPLSLSCPNNFFQLSFFSLWLQWIQLLRNSFTMIVEEEEEEEELSTS